MPKSSQSESMSDGEIISRIEQEEAVAYGINDNALSVDRAKAISYYLGEPFGNEVEGRSQVVSFDVLDTIEGALPQLLKVFVSGDQVVKFNPRGPEDEEAAEQETDYINYVVMEKNPGFQIFYTWFKDAMLSKNGYIKVWYEKETETTEETYKGLTEGQLAMLVQDDGVKVIEHASYPDPQSQQMHDQAAMQAPGVPLPPPPMLHDVKISVTETKGCIKVQNVAPEAMMVSVDAQNTKLQDVRFVQHREHTTISELRDQGFKIPDDVQFNDNDFFFTESNARDIYSENTGLNSVNEVSDEVLVKDTYVRIDGKKHRYVIVSQAIIHHEEEPEVTPFACLTPIPMPHRHIGRSYADLTMDIQQTKSSLIRGQLDNVYLSNNGRYAISDKVSLEDMLISRPGGIVRVTGSPSGEILPFQHPPLPQSSFAMVEYMDSTKEKRTGITAYNQGLDADSLNKTAHGISQIMSAAMARLELVARLFAETGVKDLFLMVHRLVRQNYTKPDIMRIRNKWVDVDPREWRSRSDMSITVGLGTGNKDAQLGHLQTILAAQKELGLPLQVATPKNVYNALSKLTQNAGFKNTEEFWTDPGDKPIQPPPDPEAMKVQAQAQMKQSELQQKDAAHQREIQADMQLETHKQQVQAEQIAQQNELQAQRDQMKAELDAQLEAQRMQHEAMMAQQEQALEQWKVQFVEAVKVTIAQINAKTTMDSAMLGAEAAADRNVIQGMS